MALVGRRGVVLTERCVWIFLRGVGAQLRNLRSQFGGVWLLRANERPLLEQSGHLVGGFRLALGVALLGRIARHFALRQSHLTLLDLSGSQRLAHDAPAWSASHSHLLHFGDQRIWQLHLQEQVHQLLTQLVRIRLDHEGQQHVFK